MRAVLFAIAALGLVAAGQNQKLDEAYTAKIRQFTTEPFFLTELVDHLPRQRRCPHPRRSSAMRSARRTSSPTRRTFTGICASSRRPPRGCGSTTSASRRRGARRFWSSSPTRPISPGSIACAKSMRGWRTRARRRPTEAAKLDRRGTSVLLGVRIHPFPRDGLARDADGTGVPARCRGVAENPEHPAQLAGDDHAGARGGRARPRRSMSTTIGRRTPRRPAPNLVYWGKYVAHDNNRDGMGLALALSRIMTRTSLDWHPQVLHDLHESIPFLYISTGMGPYNAWLDPILVNEWQKMAYHEVEEMTKRGGARRLDVGLLRRLGSELHDLRRSRPQRDRPLLRDVWRDAAPTPAKGPFALRSLREPGTGPTRPCPR